MKRLSHLISWSSSYILFQEMACASAGPASAGTAGQGTLVKSGWEKSTNIFLRTVRSSKKALLNSMLVLNRSTLKLLHVYNSIHCTGYKSPLLKQGFPFFFMQVKQIWARDIGLKTRYLVILLFLLQPYVTKCCFLGVFLLIGMDVCIHTLLLTPHRRMQIHGQDPNNVFYYWCDYLSEHCLSVYERVTVQP